MKMPEAPPDLKKAMSGSFERLGQYLTDPEVLKLAFQADRSWWHWDQLRFIARDKGVDPVAAWACVQISRMARFKYLPLRGHGDTPLRFAVPDSVQRQMMLIDQQLAGVIQAGEEHPVREAYRERFIIRAFREEAIASSMLEGAATTRQEAKAMLRQHRKPRNRGEKMVLNNYNAISFVRDHRSTPLTPDFLMELQGMLTRGTLDHEEQSGRLRSADDNVEVVDAYQQILHTPPPAEELPQRLTALCKYANDVDSQSDFVHPVIKAIILHFQIAFDHPFCDGNGRTARAVFYWFMLRSGYWLFEYLPISRLIYRSPAKYGRSFLLTETDEFDLTYFINYNIRIIGRGRQELNGYLDRKQNELYRSAQILANDPNLNHRQRDVLKRVLRNPHQPITILDHMDNQHVAYGTARSDLLGLENRGFLSKRIIGNRFEFAGGPRLSQIELP